MSNALKRGRTLLPDAVKKAAKWREKRVETLQKRAGEGFQLALSRKERRELANLKGG